jgi:predicted NUDIX family NTP pyrophosphohydrolase
MILIEAAQRCRLNFFRNIFYFFALRPCYNKIMAKVSAGLLMYRIRCRVLEVFLVHPGGPFFAKRDTGVWGIPKGELDEGEDALAAAQREFGEETGFKAQGVFLPLTPVTQKGGKIVQAWAMEGDCDPTKVKSNLFTMEWPPQSGRQQKFPEVDRAGWFGIADAKQKINPAQIRLLEELQQAIRSQRKSFQP